MEHKYYSDSCEENITAWLVSDKINVHNKKGEGIIVQCPNVFIYFWNKILANKHMHSSMELQELSVFVQMWHNSSQFHAGMCTFGSQILLLKICKYI
jgi:hypothetical protein